LFQDKVALIQKAARNPALVVKKLRKILGR